MASCQITVAGGTVLIRYTLAGTPNDITADAGDPVFIDSTATNVTYTPLTVGATASSGCLVINLLVKNCYIYSWEFNKKVLNCSGIAVTAMSDYEFSELYYNPSTLAIEPLPFTTPNPLGIADHINDINHINIKAVAYKSIVATNVNQSFIILEVFGTVIPEIVATSIIGNHKIYLKGTLTSDCLPTGYTAVDIC